MKHFTALILLFPSIFIMMSTKGNQMDDQALSARQKSIVSISSYTAQGNLDELKVALNKGLDAGLSVNEIKEVLVHLYAYCGFPRSLQGIMTFMSVLEERKSEGINDHVGQAASPIDESEDKYERGRKVLEVLTNQKQTRPTSGFGAFSPEIDVFLKEHLFADLFGRDVLTYNQRELVTISALASMEGVEPMLMAHLNMGINVGITETQLDDLFSVIETTAGKKQSEAGRSILKEIINSRKKNE
jgi:4-carboxymuconolactone decarboxylase